MWWKVLFLLSGISQALSLDNGWIPLSLDEVLSRYASQYEASSAHTPIKRWSSPVDVNDGDVTTKSDIIVTRPHKISRFGKDDENFYDITTKGVEKVLQLKHSKSVPCKIGNSEAENRKTIMNKKYKNEEKTSESSNSFEIYSDNQSRRGKQIYGAIAGTKQDSHELDTSSDENMVSKITNNYDVTEPTVDKEPINSEQIVHEENPGYIYSSPNKKFNDSNNLTSVLLNILTKYNIHINNDDNNYAISRANPSKDPRQKFLLVTLPIRVPQGHNSGHHASRDPVLATLLSNYGVYLPGMYGSTNNYKNLYGYLASNNIHNNRPFGAYKIFSDTDSSN